MIIIFGMFLGAKQRTAQKTGEIYYINEIIDRDGENSVILPIMHDEALTDQDCARGVVFEHRQFNGNTSYRFVRFYHGMTPDGKIDPFVG